MTQETRYWIRTCQECRHKQHTKPIERYRDESWRNVMCVKCRSEALDYGSWVTYRDGKPVKVEDDWGPNDDIP